MKCRICWVTAIIFSLSHFNLQANKLHSDFSKPNWRLLGSEKNPFFFKCVHEQQPIWTQTSLEFLAYSKKNQFTESWQLYSIGWYLNKELSKNQNVQWNNTNEYIGSKLKLCMFELKTKTHLSQTLIKPNWTLRAPISITKIQNSCKYMTQIYQLNIMYSIV